jgi:hypothetical protein
MCYLQGRIQRGAHPACTPPKIGKNMIFLRKIMIFHTKYAKGGAKICGVFRVKNHDFTQKNPIFSNCRGRRENLWGYFVWKIMILRKKIIFFPILGGVHAGCAPLWIRNPGSATDLLLLHLKLSIYLNSQQS